MSQDTFTFNHDDIVYLTNEDGQISFSRPSALLDLYETKSQAIDLGVASPPSPKEGLYILLEEFQLRWSVKDRTYRLRVPKGYITDVASVPRLVWTFSGFVPDGYQRNAALIHDCGYGWQGQFPLNWFQHQQADSTWANVQGTWSKSDVDKLFLRIMKACGVGPVKRFLMYKAVAWFGGIAWANIDPSRENYRNAFVDG